MKLRRRVLDIFIVILTLFVVMQIFLPQVGMTIVGFRSFVVISDSMEPEINVQDIVLVRKVNADQLEIGDTITFYTHLPTIYKDENNQTIYQKHVVTHRIGDLIRDQETLIIKTYGLKNNPNQNFDEWRNQKGEPTDLTSQDVIGKVFFKIPKLGVLSLVLYQVFSNPILLLLIIFNLVIIYVVFKLIIKTRKAMKRV